MKVTLLAQTQSPDALAEHAGRVCYQSFHKPNPATADNDTYLANILRQQHYSVLEHASVTFYIQDVSRSLTHELVRHRHFSFSQLSQRYVEPTADGYVVPPALRNLGSARLSLQHAWEAGIHAHRAVFLELRASGYTKKQAAEAARAFLPGCAATEIVVSGNLRAWREFLQKRLSPHADAEIQELAKEILRQLKELAPNTFQDFA